MLVVNCKTILNHDSYAYRFMFTDPKYRGKRGEKIIEALKNLVVPRNIRAPLRRV
jgi:hypothetical protein